MKFCKFKINRKTAERVFFIALITGLIVFGIIKDSDAAQKLIHAAVEAFTLLFNNP